MRNYFILAMRRLRYRLDPGARDATYLEQSQTDSELQLEDANLPHALPVFEPRETAIFGIHETCSSIRFYNIKRYRKKVRKDAAWLLMHGYCNMIADYSSHYGFIALEELLSLRREHRGFRVFSVKIMGLNWRLSTWKEFIHEIYLTLECDQDLGLRTVDEYTEKLCGAASAFSTERGLVVRHHCHQPCADDKLITIVDKI